LSNAQQALAYVEALQAARVAHPGDFYHPAPHQLAFHRSLHPIRILALGNRGGKTFAGAMECMWTLSGRHPYQPAPKAPVMGAWVCQDFGQFRELAKRELEPKVWDAGWKFDETWNTYRWPNGSTLRVISTERGWRFIQGLNWDFMHFDEGFPYALWQEASMRRFGDRDCRYTMTLTDTNSLSAWLRDEFYLPWLRHHAEAGLPVTEGNEDAAMLAQTHPEVFIWPKGGIADNPHASQKNIDWYRNRRFVSEEDRRTRLGGGFRRMGGNLVFDAEGLGYARACIAEAPPPLVGSLKLKGRDEPLWKLSVRDVLAGEVEFNPVADPCYEVRVWEPPKWGRQYVGGADFGQGIEGGDRDTFCGLDITATQEEGGKPRQVVEMEGRLGITVAPVLLALCKWYNDLYLLGENQGGGADAMGLMWHAGYRYLYLRRAEHHVNALTAANPRIGYTPLTGIEDPAMSEARRVIKAQGVVLRSPRLVSEMEDYVLERPDPSSPEYTPDADLVMKLKTGKSPDLIKSAAYAVFARGHATLLPRPAQAWPKGSMGDLLKKPPPPAKSGGHLPRSGWIKTD
jgi:hypothetical protein